MQTFNCLHLNNMAKKISFVNIFAVFMATKDIFKMVENAEGMVFSSVNFILLYSQ